MAFVDIPLRLSNAQAITTSAASSVIYDVTGAGSGVAPAMTFGVNGLTGAAALPGADIGNADGASAPGVLFTVTTTGTGTGTVAFGIEAAIDNGSNAPGTYVRLATSNAAVGTTLIAGDAVFLTIPPFVLINGAAEGKPRFYRAFYDQTGNGAVSVTAQILINAPLGVSSTTYSGGFASV